MGMIRKMTSISTGGLVDFRSDKERTAAYTKASKKEAKKQNRLMERQAEEAAKANAVAAAQYAATQAPAAESDVTTKLAELASLHTAGALTDDEFTAAKAKLLG